MTKRFLLAMTAAGLLAAAPALAQVSATAATDLNLRAGPAGNQQILAVIPSGGEVAVQGCLEAANWCQVNFEGTDGWAYGDYLNATAQDQQVVVIESRDVLSLPTVTFAQTAETDGGAGELSGAATGAALAAALIGGPAAIAAGAALGATLGDDDPALTFVRSNPVEPVYLDGEVVVGAGVPEGVNMIQVPETQYSYANVNGVPVIVNQDRSIVRIIRD
jgi:uncharacterized protein YraI